LASSDNANLDSSDQLYNRALMDAGNEALVTAPEKFLPSRLTGQLNSLSQPNINAYSTLQMMNDEIWNFAGF